MKLSSAQEKKINAAMLSGKDYTVLDIETSDLRLKRIRKSGATQEGIILQVGGVQVRGGKRTTFSYIVDPRGQGVTIDKPWLESFKRTKAYKTLPPHLRSVPFQGYQGKIYSVKEVVQELNRIYHPRSKGLLIGHNIKGFDELWLREKLGWSVAPEQVQRVVDTLEIARGHLRDVRPLSQRKKRRSFALQDIAKERGYQHAGLAHDAVSDALTTEMLWNDLRKEGSGLGEIVKNLYGSQNLEDIHRNNKLNRENKKYRAALNRSKEKQTAIFGHVVSTPEELRDVTWEYMPKERTQRVIDEEFMSGVYSKNIPSQPPIDFNVARENMEASFQDWQDSIAGSPDAAMKEAKYLRDYAAYRSSGMNILKKTGVAPAMKRRVRTSPLTRGFMSQYSQAKIAQAGIDYIRRATKSRSLQEAKDYAQTREMEEAVFKGTHSKGTLELVKKRSKYWRDVSARSMDIDFLMQDLGFTESQATVLKGGRSPKGARYTKRLLKKVFAFKMAEYEVLGHLPSDLSGMATSRIVSIGDFGREPGAHYVGTLRSGKDVFIPLEQQPGLIRKMFGIETVHRIAGTGKIATPEQMSRVRISHAIGEDISTLPKFRKYVEKRMAIEGRLAELEAKGQIKSITPVDLYRYGSGEAGREKNAVEFADKEKYAYGANKPRDVWMGGPEPYQSQSSQEAFLKRVLSTSEKGTSAAGNLNVDLVEPGVDPWSLAGEALGPAEDIYSTGKSTAAKDSVNLKNIDTQDHSIGYIENAGAHQAEYNALKKFTNDAFIYEMVYRGGKPGRIVYSKGRHRRIPGTKGKKIRVFKGYSPEVRRVYEEELGKYRESFINVPAGDAKKANELLSIQAKIDPNVRKQVMNEQGEWVDIAEERAERLKDIYLLQDTANESSKLMQSVEVPNRALAEKVFPVYFRKSKTGKYGAYTQAGEFLGETRGRGIPPWKGAAKIFEYKGKYSVGWAPSDEPFYWNRFGAVEQGMSERAGKAGVAIEDIEINRLGDLPPGQRLRWNRGLQQFLAKKYEAPAGPPLSKEELAKLEARYSRRARAVERLRIKRMATADAAAGGAGGGAGGGGGGFGGATAAAFRKSKGRDMAFAALAVSAALISLTAFSSRRQIQSPKDVPRQQYGSGTDDERMYNSRPQNQQQARVTPEYAGPMGYTTNIDVSTTDRIGVDHRNLSEVMNRHASNTLRTNRGSVNMEINDNSDRANQADLHRRYSNMLRS